MRTPHDAWHGAAGQHLLQRQRIAHPVQSAHHLGVALVAPADILLAGLAQARAAAVDEQPDHMAVVALLQAAREFDARNGAQLRMARGGRQKLLQPRDGVMVSEGNRGQARTHRLLDEFRRP